MLISAAEITNHMNTEQDARRRKLDSGRVDAEAVIDELMEVKTKKIHSNHSAVRLVD